MTTGSIRGPRDAARQRRRVAGHGAAGFALRGGAGSSSERLATYGFALHRRRRLCSSDFDVRSISLPLPSALEPLGGASVAWTGGGDIVRTDHSEDPRLARRNGGFRRCAGDRRHGSIAAMRSVLTEDERRVLDLLSVGLPMHDIAQLLRISDERLRAHVASLLRHYGADDRTTLVATAYRRGDAPGLRRLARSVAMARTR